jgi:hypothetical protein
MGKFTFLSCRRRDNKHILKVKVYSIAVIELWFFDVVITGNKIIIYKLGKIIPHISPNSVLNRDWGS